MRMGFILGTFAIVAAVSAANASQLILTASDDAQLDRATFANGYVLTNPPGNNSLYMEHNLSSTGQLHQGFLEYSLASLPTNAVITSASFTYTVNLISSSSNGGTTTYSSISLNLYDGGDGQISLADISKGTFNVAQSQDLPTTGVYTTNFFDVSALNGRAVNFPSGYLGLSLFPRVEALQAQLWSDEGSVSFGFQRPVITLNFTQTPEPASLSVFAIGAVALLRRRK